MPTRPSKTIKPEQFIARVYQFARDDTSVQLNRPSYALPSCWGDTHPVWGKLLQTTRGRNIDPVCYLHWALSINRIAFDPIPEPNQLLSANVVATYLDEKSRLSEGMMLSLRLQNERVRDDIRRNQRRLGKNLAVLVEMALLDVSLELSWLYRYMLAWSFFRERPDLKRFEEIAADFRLRALFQFRCRLDDSIEVYQPGTFLPADFASESVSTYERIIKLHVESIAKEIRK